jgi:hypothetical protein
LVQSDPWYIGSLDHCASQAFLHYRLIERAAAVDLDLPPDDPEAHSAEEGLGGDNHVRKQAGIAANARLTFDLGHEGDPNAAMLIAVVDIEAVDLSGSSQLDEADHGTAVLGDQDSIAREKRRNQKASG